MYKRSLQLQVVEPLFQHYIGDRQELPRRGAEGLAIALFASLARIELHERSAFPIGHCQDGADGAGAEALMPLVLVIFPWRSVLPD